MASQTACPMRPRAPATAILTGADMVKAHGRFGGGEIRRLRSLPQSRNRPAKLALRTEVAAGSGAMRMVWLAVAAVSLSGCASAYDDPYAYQPQPRAAMRCGPAGCGPAVNRQQYYDERTGRYFYFDARTGRY